MNKSILTAFICVLTTFSISLLSCDESNGIGTEAADTNEITAAAPLMIAENGKALYKIIRAEEANTLLVNEVISFRRSLEEKTGISFKLETDWLKTGAKPDMNAPEITVGITNRNISVALGTVGNFKYSVKINGNKLEILAGDSSALRAAIDMFLSDEVLYMENDNVYVKGLPLSGKADLAAGEIPNFEFGEIEGVYSSSEDTTIVKVNNTTADNYTAYLDLLRSTGFEDYASNKIGNNLFTTLTNDKTNVSYYYIASTGVTRIVYEPKRPLYTREQDNKYEDLGYDSLLTGMKGETSVASEGMGFIIRLCDGSFVIIDGGMGDPNHVDADKLYNILMSQSPDGTEKPVIAAWLFSHLHGDHIGVFNCFSIDYHDKVTIESIYYSFPKEEEVAVSDSPYMLDDTIYRYTQFKKCRAEYYSGVPYIKVHTGDKFYVKNAVFEVLETLEDLCPKTILDGGMNESTVLYRMTLGRQTTLWTGDIGYNAVDMALTQFGGYIKSDMLQLAHHGLNGTVEFYSTVDPEYSFLPIWAGGFESVKDSTQNRWLINSDKMKHMIVTCYGTWTIKLPYAPVEGTYDRLPSAGTVHPSYPALLGE